MTPRRIQRQRTPGWRMPEGAVYVGRPTRWGNPFRVEEFMGGWSVDGPIDHLDVYEEREPALRRAVDEYRRSLTRAIDAGAEWLEVERLRGRDLVCWCPLDQPCHADVLLEVANR